MILLPAVMSYRRNVSPAQGSQGVYVALRSLHSQSLGGAGQVLGLAWGWQDLQKRFSSSHDRTPPSHHRTVLIMIGATQRWLKRNRNIIAVGAGVVGVGYLAGQYVVGKLNETRQRLSDDRIAKEKYGHQFKIV